MGSSTVVVMDGWMTTCVFFFLLLLLGDECYKLLDDFFKVMRFAPFRQDASTAFTAAEVKKGQPRRGTTWILYHEVARSRVTPATTFCVSRIPTVPPGFLGISLVCNRKYSELHTSTFRHEDLYIHMEQYVCHE